jgi:hypothetical protein
LTAAPPVPRKRRKAEVKQYKKTPTTSTSTQQECTTCDYIIYLHMYWNIIEEISATAPSVPRKRQKAVMAIETIQNTQPYP